MSELNKTPKMLRISPEINYALSDVLFVFALESEAADLFSGYPTLFAV